METNKKLSINPAAGTTFTNPQNIIQNLDFRNGMKVANFGCGTGFFVLPIAEKIEPDGTVFALDVRKEKLEVVESQAKISGLTNIVVKRVNLEAKKGSGLSSGSADWVIIANMLFQNSNKDVILKEAGRILKKNGKILLVEWKEKNFPIGPKKSIKISREEMKKIAEKNNFEIIKEIEVSNFHYGLILTPCRFSAAGDKSK
jgi:ubiquinone/menaquinone biosynthesis C-methylase UbiE